MGPDTHGVHHETMEFVVREIGKVVSRGVEVALVVGGGNIFRGLSAAGENYPRHMGDTMGMLATIMNALSLTAYLQKQGIDAEMMSALSVGSRVTPFNAAHAMSQLSKGRVVVFGGGTGNPFFTTDTAAVLRALEIGADLLIKATKVDGVYDADPVKHPNAQMFDVITYREVLQRNLRVMDQAAVALALDNRLPLHVLNLMKSDGMVRALSGEAEGTRVVL